MFNTKKNGQKFKMTVFFYILRFQFFNLLIVMKNLLITLAERFDLRSEMEDYNLIHQEIEKGIIFRGTNLWILMFAIVVASVGLNMNSTAVIIGAMLISPLMGPINGMGYSLATYDFQLFRRAIKNFTYAVITSLITSTVYFLISPINEAHSELLARTSPSIYDVLIALFGGLAGIVAISSKLKGNVIPGVAIATALMPPICTAGYGLASLQLKFFFGALYLFTINTVFIAFAALIVCQFLKFPIRSIVDTDRKRSVNRGITAIILLTAVPSIYFGYKLVREENFNQNVDSFLKEVSVVEGNYLQRSDANANNHSVELVYSGYGLSESNYAEIKTKALMSKIDTSKLTIKEGFGASYMEANTRKFQTETEQLTSKLTAAQFALQKAEAKNDSLMKLSGKGEVILKEIKAIFPQITRCIYSESNAYRVEKDSTLRSPRSAVVILYSGRNALINSDKTKIENWIKKRLNDENSIVVFDND